MTADLHPDASAATASRWSKAVALVGLMGAGKTSVGRRLAPALGLRFADSDAEIEAAAGMSIADIFQTYGEPAFRDLERRVVARLLEGPPAVIALGGGAFVDETTRALVLERAIVIWLNADLDILVERTARRPGKRPLLAGGELRATLADLLERRHPAYAQAHIAVDSGTGDIERIVAACRCRIRTFGASHDG